MKVVVIAAALCVFTLTKPWASADEDNDGSVIRQGRSPKGVCYV